MRALWILALSVLPCAAVAQESDKDFLTRFLEENLSSAGRVVTITGFQGALSTRATMAEMTIADDLGIWLTVRDVTLDWSQSALLSGQIIIDEFSAGDIVLDRVPISDSGTAFEAGSFALPDLPVSVDVKSIAARHIALGPTVLGQSVEGQLVASMQLAGGEGAARLDLTRTDDGPEGQFHLTAAFERDSGQIDLSIAAIEGAGGVAVSLLGVPGAPSAELVIAGSGPVSNFGADVSLKTDDVIRLAGRVALTTTPEGSGFTADLSGDPTPVFLPQYATFFGPDVGLHAKGQRFADGHFELSEFSVTAQALTLDGKLSLDANRVPLAFALTGTIGLPDGPVLLPQAAGNETRLQYGTLSLNYDRATGDEWQGSASLQGLDHAVFDAETVQLTGAGHIRRDAGGARFDGRFDFDAAGLSFVDPGLAQAVGRALTGRATVNWATGGALAVTDLSLQGAGFDIVTTGTIGDLAKGLSLTGTVRGSVDNLAQLSTLAGRDLGGAARFDLSGTGNLLTGFADVAGTLNGTGLKTGVDLLDGVLSEESAVNLSLRRDENGTKIRKLDLVAKGVRANVAGQIAAKAVAVYGDIAVSDLAVIRPGFGGGLAGKMSLTGPLDTVLLSLDATGDNLALGQRQLDGLLRGQSQLKLALSVKDGDALIRQADLTLPSGTLQAKGRMSAAGNDIDATVQLTDLRALGFGLRGTMDGKLRFTGQPRQGRLLVDAGLAALAVGQTEVDILLRGNTSMTAALDLTPDGIGVADLNLFNPQMRLVATGQLNGTERRLIVEHRIFDLGLLYPQFPGALTSTGTAIQDATGYALDLKSKGPAQIDATVTGRLTRDLRRADLVIRGTASAGLANKAAAPRSLSGPVRFDLRMQGPIGLASLSGPVTLSGGRLADPGQNFALTDMGGTAQLSGGQAQVSGVARVTSGGNVAMRGSVSLTRPYVADLALSLTGVGLRDPDLYTTRADGALTVTGPILGTALVAGTVNLGRTELRIPPSGFGADGALPGLQHVNEPAASRATRRRAEGPGDPGAAGGSAGYALDVRVNAPNQVFIRGRGLDAELGGSLVLRGHTNAIVPSGSFSLIRGRLDILGRRLNLSEALLQLQGALVPYVRIVASVDSDGITASVLIEGNANDPEVSFTSDPPLPQDEVLARLLFDRGLENLTAFQAIQLAGAVATLVGSGGEGLVGNLRKRAGIDNLDVTTADDGSTALTVGKYISDKAYTEATVSQGGKSSISLNLDLAPHITLKGHLDSDGQTGIGVFLQRDY